ncbi:DUF1523 family protein [Pukyongiella litopenaei]|uniref:DUF1523 family protein n=1 Tax=Pukyongiella litopenaei TaxID=2605946 RepID=A0A2S0MPP8_9RHOB|nr:DUF1523 family protein [Pukyongiella litopenaei]AVO37816.1 DUF1523 family protein [Pukyongiella litopenaei]
MVYVKWVLILVLWLLAGSFLHYTLPHQDVVRVVNTEVRRVDFGENSIFWAQNDTGQEATGSINRDVRFIEAFNARGRPMVYRNEDTGWGWPPYFKLDSSNLQTEVHDLISTKDNPKWVVLRHYGWRNEFLSIYPNAVAVRPVEGPDVRLIPWFNIIVLTLLAAICWAIWVRWRRFRQARIDPVLEKWGDDLDEAGVAMAEKRSRFRRWLSNWRS